MAPATCAQMGYAGAAHASPLPAIAVLAISFTNEHATFSYTSGSLPPGAREAKDFDDAVQPVVRTLIHKAGYDFRGFNPSLVAYQGQDYVVVRAGNFTRCPDSVTNNDLRSSIIYHTEVSHPRSSCNRGDCALLHCCFFI